MPGKRTSVRVDRRVVGVATLMALSLSACSSGSDPRFEVSDLAAGACRDAGEALLAVERSQRELAAGDIEPDAAAADYKDLQDHLLDARDGAPPEVASGLRSLVTAMGFFRVGVDAGTLGDAQTDQVREALDDTLDACGVELEG